MLLVTTDEMVVDKTTEKDEREETQLETAFEEARLDSRGPRRRQYYNG